MAFRSYVWKVIKESSWIDKFVFGLMAAALVGTLYLSYTEPDSLLYQSPIVFLVAAGAVTLSFLMVWDSYKFHLHLQEIVEQSKREAKKFDDEGEVLMQQIKILCHDRSKNVK